MGWVLHKKTLFRRETHLVFFNQAPGLSALQKDALSLWFQTINLVEGIPLTLAEAI